MACNSPLRRSCPELNIGDGYLYRRRGTIVRINDSEGVSCRSSVYTVQITGSEISHWKQHANCPVLEESHCDGCESVEKHFKWRLPIPPLRLEAVGSQPYLFDARWNPTRCDQTHCVIAIMENCQVVNDFSTFSEKNRISINEYLKRSSFA